MVELVEMVEVELLEVDLLEVELVEMELVEVETVELVHQQQKKLFIKMNYKKQLISSKSLKKKIRS